VRAVVLLESRRQGVRRTIERVWASGDLACVFGAGAPKSPCPWPRSGRSKTGPPLRHVVTADFVTAEVRLTHVDPRQLWCSQPWVLLEHARYYTTGRWEITGETSADRHDACNRYPIVIDGPRGELVIVSGHHRALVALVEGRPLLCRRTTDHDDGAIARRPHLLVGDSTHLPAVRCSIASQAVEVMRARQIALVASDALAHDTMETLERGDGMTSHGAAG
jgi:hypothetical protein